VRGIAHDKRNYRGCSVGGLGGSPPGGGITARCSVDRRFLIGRPPGWSFQSGREPSGRISRAGLNLRLRQAMHASQVRPLEPHAGQIRPHEHRAGEVQAMQVQAGPGFRAVGAVTERGQGRLHVRRRLGREGPAAPPTCRRPGRPRRPGGRRVGRAGGGRRPGLNPVSAWSLERYARPNPHPTPRRSSATSPSEIRSSGGATLGLGGDEPSIGVMLNYQRTAARVVGCLIVMLVVTGCPRRSDTPPREFGIGPEERCTLDAESDGVYTLYLSYPEYAKTVRSVPQLRVGDFVRFQAGGQVIQHYGRGPTVGPEGIDERPTEEPIELWPNPYARKYVLLAGLDPGLWRPGPGIEIGKQKCVEVTHDMPPIHLALNDNDVRDNQSYIWVWVDLYHGFYEASDPRGRPRGGVRLPPPPPTYIVRPPG
jgi:hypothetical protein